MSNGIHLFPHCQYLPLLLGYGFQIVLQNISAPNLRDHSKNEIEAEEMSEDDASIYSSIIEDEIPYPLQVEECDALELSQFEISPNQMNKRPREDECDDAALLPSVKKPHTDFSDLLSLTGEDKEQSTEQEGEDESTKGRMQQQQTGQGKCQQHGRGLRQQLTQFGIEMKSKFPHSEIG